MCNKIIRGAPDNKLKELFDLCTTALEIVTKHNQIIKDYSDNDEKIKVLYDAYVKAYDIKDKFDTIQITSEKEKTIEVSFWFFWKRNKVVKYTEVEEKKIPVTVEICSFEEFKNALKDLLYDNYYWRSHMGLYHFTPKICEKQACVFLNKLFIVDTKKYNTTMYEQEYKLKYYLDILNYCDEINEDGMIAYITGIIKDKDKYVSDTFEIKA